MPMLKNLVLTIGTSIALAKATKEPIEFAVLCLETVADKLEEVANYLEEHLPQKEK